ncbi:hypothetical protein LTR56_024339 [Elasticomyces elasticus]|nr:hypothetical protein LTR56_024339 [Elasticomyces elasticus]KAK3623205.1 hypothetical protein LTR22_024504 [Elasticomyces elasticus]KAK4905739.1 hypothetical protein LTR49_024988 [Elasticomyces elasticus]KAK5743219.1 hypothetical protein LTS12_023948 [Elasticomyces elasticus]
MSSSTDDCEKVSSTCPVQATTYGYAPNLPSNAIYTTIFALCAPAQLVHLTRYCRFWKGYTFLVCVACVGECCGYVGRLLLHKNPWDGAAMSIQFILLMISPSFLAAALYMTLRTLVEYFGTEHTKLPARLWTWPFVTADFVGFVCQCAGGIMASVGGSLGTVGTALMITGVTLQAVIIAIAGALAVDFGLRVWRQQGTDAVKVLPFKLKIFFVSMAVALLLILARCIYRIPELAEGVGGPLMRKEVEFMVFDGLFVFYLSTSAATLADHYFRMIVIATLLLTILHPGHLASEMRNGKKYAFTGELAGYELCDNA